jgi:hypothetical protein
MDELLKLCVTAFTGVFVVLAVLAAVIRLITVLFPDRPGRWIDPALVAAVGSAVAVVHPGARVTSIVEET